jgi:predicted dehydrogenase
VAVADPDARARDRFGEAHGIPGRRRFAEAAELFALGRLGEACLVTSPDRCHAEQAISALEAGYDILLEKPMAATLGETDRLVGAARASSAQVHVAHVLRYTPFFRVLHEAVTSGRLGEIITVEHRENVVAWHMAHSYVRGNWSKTADATPMIVAKCCHDFDILQWNLGSRVKRMASFGSLLEFRPERAPSGAAGRCTDPCPVEDCPYDARRIYLNMAWTGWPVEVITHDLSYEGRLRALREGPYGCCVYAAGSNAVDHQVVMMELESGASVSLHMHGHSHEEARTMRYDGTRATLRGSFGRHEEIDVIDHATGRLERLEIPRASGGHGGGDDQIMAGFVDSVETGSPSRTSVEESYESHLLAFLAEEARLSGGVLDVAEARHEVMKD